jgi:hypothetical protein
LGAAQDCELAVEVVDVPLTVLTMTTKVLTRSQNIGLHDGVIGVSNIQATKLSRSGGQALSPRRVAGRHADVTKMAPESPPAFHR